CGCDTSSEADRLIADAQTILKELSEDGSYDGFGLLRMVNAKSEGDDLILDDRKIPALRQQTADGYCRSIADFIHPDGDYAGVFMAGAGNHINNLRIRYEKNGDSYHALLIQSLADRLAEATSEFLHYLVRKEYWGYAPDEDMDIDRILSGRYQGIRPAMGYPMLPDQLLNKDIYEMLLPESGRRVEITENGAMNPSSTVSGIYISNPESRYFIIGEIGRDQAEDYARRRGLSIERISEILNL
ncbi:MAG: methionine synthase, partial [Muribaculaceae bacterium]|nr:methionine synthase [Muribaculaceae bacterium]